MGNSMSASNDAKQYRDGYPGQEEPKDAMENVKFYSGKIKSVPDGDYIDDICQNWFGDYERLEFHHGYIQWLFPIRAAGMNMQAQPLTKYEMEIMQKDPAIQKRIPKAFDLMLDFYGFRFDYESEKVERSKKYQDRFQNLNGNMHNYLRITRILKSLGEIGFEHWKRPLCERFIEEVAGGNLSHARRSLVDYWIPTLRNEKERHDLRKICAEKYGWEIPEEE